MCIRDRYHVFLHTHNSLLIVLQWIALFAYYLNIGHILRLYLLTSYTLLLCYIDVYKRQGSVHAARLNAGKYLAQESPVDADVVIGVPDSGIDAALGLSLIHI